jgi:hypothetical protein
MNENELHDELAEINSRMHALDGNVLWINEKVTHDEPLKRYRGHVQGKFIANQPIGRESSQSIQRNPRQSNGQ